MYPFSKKLFTEFQSSQQLIRFDYSVGDNNKKESALLIQVNTLIIKYIISKIPLKIYFKKMDNKILYYLLVKDSIDKPLTIWSILDSEEEYNCLMNIVKGEKLHIYLLNELSIIVSWKIIDINESYDLFQFINKCDTKSIKQDDYQEEVCKIIDKINNKEINNFISFELDNSSDWNFTNSFYITNQIQPSNLNINKDIEGSHQEQIALWLIDSIKPEGAYYSPQIPHGDGTREFTDLLLCYENGCFLFESKALSIISREKIPTREQLIKDTSKHIEKALKQLKGAVRQLKQGTPIFTKQRELIEIDRTKAAHCIIIVSDLSLVSNDTLIDSNAIKDFITTTNCFIHLIDLCELKRIVQAANMLSSRSEKVSTIQAFDSYLIDREKIAIKKGTLNTQVLLKLV